MVLAAIALWQALQGSAHTQRVSLQALLGSSYTDYSTEFGLAPLYKKKPKKPETGSKVSKTGKHIKIPVSKKANLTTAKGIALVMEALHNVQGELVANVAQKKGEIDVDKELVIETDDNEEEDEDT